MNFSTREPSELACVERMLDAFCLCLCLFAFFSRIIICLCVAVDICSLALIFPHFYSSVVRFWVRFPFDTSPFFCHLYSFFSLYFASFSLKCNDILWHFILFVAVVFLFSLDAAASAASSVASSASVVVNLFIDDFNFVLRTYFRCLVSFSQ